MKQKDLEKEDIVNTNPSEWFVETNSVLNFSELENSDIGRDLKHFPHGWWVVAIILLEIVACLAVGIYILLR